MAEHRQTLEYSNVGLTSYYATIHELVDYEQGGHGIEQTDEEWTPLYEAARLFVEHVVDNYPKDTHIHGEIYRGIWVEVTFEDEDLVVHDADFEIDYGWSNYYDGTWDREHPEEA